MRRYYRKSTDRLLKASMGALMAAETNPVRTLVIGPFAITWARHAETDKTTYSRFIEALTVAEYSEEYKLNKARAEAWHEGYGCGRDDEEAETHTNQMHATLNPYRKAQTND